MGEAITLAMWDKDRQRYICVTCSYLPEHVYKLCGKEGCLEAALAEERERCAEIADQEANGIRIGETIARRIRRLN